MQSVAIDTDTVVETEVLPIVAFKDQIMACKAPYLIVKGETGSGKSTMVPQWFAEQGLRVLVVEPLVETVLGTSEFVADLMGCRLGTRVGYRIGGGDRCDSRDTQILFVTDGLALIRELSGHNRFDVLILDELHLWSKNQSTLEAWVWKTIQEGNSSFKQVVVLSATMDTKGLSEKRGQAPVFEVPGRQYSIEDRPAGYSLEEDVAKLVKEGHDVLVFHPGQREIEECIDKLKKAGVDAEFLPFHGEVERPDKNKAYRQDYSRPKVIVSTNALETGRTVPSRHGHQLAVVDSGMEKRMELVDGIEVLCLKAIPKASGLQRRGRTGRTGPGIYIDHCRVERTPYSIPEILRTRLDQTVLRLATFRYDATDLPFFHELNHDLLVDAKRSLRALGAMSKDDSVTRMGHFMARLPVSVQCARMVVEAEKRGVVDEVVTIAAILSLKNRSIRDKSETWRKITQEQESDLLAELDLWNAARQSRGEEFRQIGVFSPDYFGALENRRKLSDALRQHRVDFRSTGSREDILKSCVAGMVDHLYKHVDSRVYKNGSNGVRELDNKTAVKTYPMPSWIVGVPKGIEFNHPKRGLMRKNLVTMATKVDPTWLMEIAPQLARQETGINPQFDAGQDCVVSTTRSFFNDQQVKEETVADPTHPQAPTLFASWLASQMV